MEHKPEKCKECKWADTCNTIDRDRLPAPFCYNLESVLQDYEATHTVG